MGKPNSAPLWNIPSRPATDAAVLSAAIDFANGSDLVLEAETTMVGSEAERKEFVRRLSAAVGDRSSAAGEFHLTTPKVNLTYTLIVRNDVRHLRRGLFYEFRSVSALLDYALALVLDDTHEIGSRVSQCKLGRCRAFYVAQPNPRGGPLPTVFCSPKHRTEFHDSSERRLGKVK